MVRTTGEAVTVQAVERDGALVTVRLRSNPRLPMGEFSGQLLLEVHSPAAARRIELPYSGQVVPNAATADPTRSLTSSEAQPQSAPVRGAGAPAGG